MTPFSSKYWYQVSPVDVRARMLADRHYSRQTPGAREFCPPGNKVVLIVPGVGGIAEAVWASQRPDPQSGLGRADGFEYWSNVIFRNESGIRSSDLIREAVAITKWHWHDVIPADGFHTFVNPRKVRGVKVRGTLVHGFSFMKAGFQMHPERTKMRDLIRWVLPTDAIREMVALEPLQEQMMLAI